VARGPGLLDPGRRAASPATARLAGIAVGGEHPVAVVGALNISPESFHGGSVHRQTDELLRAAHAMVEAGAVIVDVGARSTAPYLPTEVTEVEERARLVPAVTALARVLPVPVSADTSRATVARAALDAGARIVNDVSGLRDPEMGALVAERRAGLVLMAYPFDIGGGGTPPPIPPRFGLARDAASGTRDAAPGTRDAASGTRDAGGDPGSRVRDEARAPLRAVSALLDAALARARVAGIDEQSIVLDPGIGFFRDTGVPWHDWDVAVLTGLTALAALGRPLMIGVSRKSFLGAITGRAAAADRLAASLAATAIAVLYGAALVRTHDVAETVDAVRVAERLRREARP